MAPNSLHPPPSVVASWPPPNYVNPETQGVGVIVVGLTFTCLAMLLVLARLWSRLFITRAPGMDDLFAVLALVCEIGLLGIIIDSQQNFGLGRHIWDAPTEWAVPNRKLVWAGEWLYVASSAFIKISVLLFYRRLSAPFTKVFLVATWVGIIYNILYVIAFLLTLLLICRPVNSYWESFDPYWVVKGNKFSCGKEEISLPLSGVFSVLGDLYSTVLPLFLVWNLQLPRRQKLALYTLFALGFIVVAAGIVRTVLLDKVINRTFDVLWYLWTYYIWAIIELTLSIIAGSAPALKPFLRRFLIEPLTSRGGRSTPRYGYGYTISSGGYGKGSYAGSRTSHAESQKRFRDVKEVEVEETKLEKIPEGSDLDESTIGTAVPLSGSARSISNEEYEMTDQSKSRGHSPPGIEMHTTYEITSEIADDDDFPAGLDHIHDGTSGPLPGQATPMGPPTTRGRADSQTRGDSETNSIGNTTLDATSWPPEQVPWDPAERVKFYARQTSG